MKQKIIKVKWVGENSGFCTEYYKSIETKKFYAKITHPCNPKDISWFSTAENYGEPDCPIKENIVFEVIE